MSSQFDPRKAVAAMAYLAKQTGESLYLLLKMMYVADKLHLERTGRFIAGDSYVAMKQGPVPSSTYDLFKAVRGDRVSSPGRDLALATFSYGSNHEVTLKADPELDELSESDVECLGEVVELLNRFGRWAIRDMSHDEAFEEVWGNPFVRFRNSEPMSIDVIASKLQNANELLAHLHDPHPGSA